jgi:asparagine synthase (glutamine-hydrolysing)
MTNVPPPDAFGCALAETKRAVLEIGGQGTALARMRLADMRGYLPDQVLQKADRATMAVSLEARAPLLSVEVARFALSLPDHLLIAKNQGKVVMRHMASRLLPAKLARRGKAGLAPPLKRWLTGPLNALARGVLCDSASRHGFFAYPGLAAAFHRLEANDERAALFLWRALCLQIWADEYLTAPADPARMVAQ